MASVHSQAEVLRQYRERLQSLAYSNRWTEQPEIFLPEEELQTFWHNHNGLSRFFANMKIDLDEAHVEFLQCSTIKLISTLIWISYASWETFQEFCSSKDRPISKLTDKLLNMSSSDEKVLERLFSVGDGGQLISEFRKWRWAFVPLRFEEGVQAVSIQIHGAIPIIETDDEIRGSGGGGIVRAVHIPASCLKTKGLHRNYVDETACKSLQWQNHPPPHRVAAKRIHSAEFYDSGRKEIENLNLLRKSHVDHKNLAKSISAVSIYPRSEIILLFQLGVGDLQQFLLGERGTALDSWKLEDLLEQMYWIGDALYFLHESLCRHIVSAEEPKTLCHLDIKPANILVYTPEDNHDDPAGIWKLTDFGISEVHELKETRKKGRTTFSAAAEMPFAGRCCAPEIFDSVEAGRRADVWSLGCVLY